MKTTLVIMAAGIGSRYGGDKQLDGVGIHGESLMEYAIYDAIRAGFRKVVFIIRPEAQKKIEELIGKKLQQYRSPEGEQIEVVYVHQDFSSIPEFYKIPAGRTKPFGTGHALLCAADVVQEPFCVVNADDYYGAEAYKIMHQALSFLPAENHAVMVGYVLENTISHGGTVSRGICKVAGGVLYGITERTKIGASPDGGLWDEDSGVTLSPDDVVSMNFWGFAPSIFPALQNYFEDFLREKAGNNPDAECYLPAMVDAERAAGKLSVFVLHSPSQWFGMTYQEDRAAVVEQLRKLHEEGFYPDSLWIN